MKNSLKGSFNDQYNNSNNKKYSKYTSIPKTIEQDPCKNHKECFRINECSHRPIKEKGGVKEKKKKHRVVSCGWLIPQLSAASKISTGSSCFY